MHISGHAGAAERERDRTIENSGVTRATEVFPWSAEVARHMQKWIGRAQASWAFAGLATTQRAGNLARIDADRRAKSAQAPGAAVSALRNPETDYVRIAR